MVDKLSCIVEDSGPDRRKANAQLAVVVTSLQLASRIFSNNVNSDLAKVIPTQNESVANHKSCRLSFLSCNSRDTPKNICEQKPSTSIPHQCSQIPRLPISPTCPSGSSKYTLFPPFSQSIVPLITTPSLLKYTSHLSTSSRDETARQ